MVVLAMLSLPGASAFGEAQKYLIVTAPSLGKVTYLALPPYGQPATAGEPLRVLIDTGLKYPQGVAVDSYRRHLFVADPFLAKLVYYEIKKERDALTVGPMKVAAEPVEVRAVAVDGLGNIFFTDEPKQKILRVSSQNLKNGITKPDVLYSAASHSQVSAPGGIAADNFFVYWLNKASGTQVGSLVRGLQYAPSSLLQENTSASSEVVSLASNAIKCYGVCLALGHAFYTDEQTNLYGIPRAATAVHDVTVVSNEFQEPRGCVYDGESTVYVADKQRNAVYQFASNMQSLSSNREMTKAVDMQGAFGLAIFTEVTS